MAYVNWNDKLNHLIGSGGYWQERIVAELSYLEEMFIAEKREYPTDFNTAIQRLLFIAETEGAITKHTVLEIEEYLASYSIQAKKYQVICAAHAHIDMNWEWGFDETVGIVIDTFQTMLNLMDEYPEFHFSQSQASTYEIINRFCPSMLDAIKQRISEGRWEVTASTWTEHDKNMAGTEAMLRHLLYTRKYLSKLLEIDPDTLTIDFEPDTFGHSANIPEILSSAGIKYYYQCRGYDRKCAYRFTAPSGAEILSYCEPNWYLGDIKYNQFLYVPSFCVANYTNTALEVYGVGDHGGGPTRRDIERIIDMNSWPLMASLRFGRINDFYKALEINRDKLPIVDRELNYVFTGCYTSQSRIKRANRQSEDKLYDSETLCAMASAIDTSSINIPAFEQAWKSVLFNQFHDILPGSGVRETREYALAIAAESNAYALANANRAMKTISDAVDTSIHGIKIDKNCTAEGGGPGFGAVKSSSKERLWAGSEFTITSVGRSNGEIRPYTLFNTTQYDRTEVTELTLWDWKYDIGDTIVVDGSGNEINWEVSVDSTEYWSHKFQKIVFSANIPAFGYANYYIIHKERPHAKPESLEPRVHHMEDGRFVMENALIHAEFESHTMKLVSLVDKKTNRHIITADAPAAILNLVDETDILPYNAWTIGNYGKIEDLNESCFVDVKAKKLTGIHRYIEYEIKFRRSLAKIRVSLDDDSALLRYSFEIDWNDQAIPNVSTPQIRFRVPYAYEADNIRYDIPGGFIDRTKYGHDVPAILYGSPIPKDGGSALMLTSDSKYGYRAVENYIEINLLRSSYTPDLYPEVGIHRFEVGIGIIDCADWTMLRKNAFCFSHPIFAYSNSVHKGVLPQKHSFITLTGSVVLSSIKFCENNRNALLFRLVGSDKTERVRIALNSKIHKAKLLDTAELHEATIETDNDCVDMYVQPFTIKSIAIE